MPLSGLTVQDVIELLGIDAIDLRQILIHRAYARFPAPRSAAGALLWDEDDVKAWWKR